MALNQQPTDLALIDIFSHRCSQTGMEPALNQNTDVYLGGVQEASRWAGGERSAPRQKQGGAV